MITPIFGTDYPSSDPATLGTAVAQLVTPGLLEVLITIANTIDGEVNIFVLGYIDSDCGWQPIATLSCNKRDSPKLAGHNRFADIEIPTQRYVCLYAPEIKAADVLQACITPYLATVGATGGGGIFGLAGLSIPDVPPASPSADDDEFNGATLDPRWNLHTTGLSINPVTWVLDTIDDATVETGHNFRYQLAAPSSPSALIIQPGGDATDQGGLSRKLSTGVVPTNWTMRAGFPVGIERLVGTSPDLSITLFMANDAPGNGFGNWDYNNFVCIFISIDYSGMVAQGAKMAGGVFSVFSTGSSLLAGAGAEPCQFVLRKTGNVYTASAKFANGQKTMFMQQNLVGLGLAPVRFGMAFTATSTPNPTIPLNYIRHEFTPRGF